MSQKVPASLQVSNRLGPSSAPDPKKKDLLDVNGHCDIASDMQWNPDSGCSTLEPQGQWLLMPGGETTTATSVDTEE